MSVPRVPIVLLVAILGSGRARSGAQGAPEVPLLERARDAIGRWSEAPPALEGRGEARVSGADGKLSWLTAPDGSFRLQIASSLPSTAAFDGHASWTRDQSGLERAIQLEEADQLRLFSWVLSSHWLDTPEVEVRAAADGRRLLLHLAGTPMEMTLALDPESGLPVELRQVGDTGGARWTFEDFTPVAGRRLARGWTHVADGAEDRFRIRSYERVTPAPGSFARSFATPRDVHFDPELASELKVLRLPSGHLLVEPLLEGEFRGAFVLDTGAGITVIDRGVADELRLETLGSTAAVGVAGTTTSGYRRGELFQLGPVTIEAPIYGDLDLGFIGTAQGRKIAGIVGYDLLARCVVEIESTPPRVALHDPEGYTLARGSWQDLVLHQNHACIRARFEGDHEGLFRVDTGAGGTLTFHAPTVSALHLLEGREVRFGQSGGVGGSAAAPEGVLAWFEFGGRRFEKPEVAFSQASSGAFTDTYTAGNIGQEFLEPFRLVLDYPHARLALVSRE